MPIVMRWNSDELGILTEARMRQQLENMGYRVQRYAYPAGTIFPDHAHDVDKIDAVLSGCLQLQIQGEPVILRAGDCVTVPRGVLHNAQVIGDEVVVSLDAIRAG